MELSVPEQSEGNGMWSRKSMQMVDECRLKGPNGYLVGALAIYSPSSLSARSASRRSKTSSIF